jgi:hypothetical protein
MDVRVHQAIRVNKPAEPLRRARQVGYEGASVVVVRDDPNARVPSCDDVLYCTRRLDSGLSRHVARIAARCVER